MQVKLWYGDGFIGRTYTLEINGEYTEIGSGLGSKDEEDKAREYAYDLLKAKGIDIDLRTVPFRWDGTL